MSTAGYKPQTRAQKFAQEAFACVERASKSEEYARFAKSFPALIQSCGLIQSLLFAKKKNIGSFLDDFLKVLGTTGTPSDIESIRELDCIKYIQASRFALEAATWLKRYSEALIREDENE